MIPGSSRWTSAPSERKSSSLASWRMWSVVMAEDLRRRLEDLPGLWRRRGPALRTNLGFGRWPGQPINLELPLLPGIEEVAVAIEQSLQVAELRDGVPEDVVD